MNFRNHTTETLIDEYYTATFSIENDLYGGFSLSDLADILVELERRGINARATTPPEWFRKVSQNSYRRKPSPGAGPSATPAL